MGNGVRGKIECLLNFKDANYNMQGIFKNLYDFFTSHSQYTLVALNYGATNGPAATGAGTGTGYWDATGSFGNNAFFVVRQNASLARPYDVYHLFQWTGANNLTRGATFGASPGNPGACRGNSSLSSPSGNGFACLAHSCAIGISGSGGTSGSFGGNPWLGGKNALTGTLGIDTKASKVWGAPTGGGTGVMIFPRSNDGGTGAFQSATQNMSQITAGAGSTADMRMHIIADDDSWVFWCDVSDSQNTSTVLAYSGIYQPRPGLPWVVNAPYCSIVYDGALPWSVANASVYGDIAGTSQQQGGIVGPITASVRPLCMDILANAQQNINFIGSNAITGSVFANMPGGGVYDEYQIPVGIYETSPVALNGFLGMIDFVRTVYNVQAPSVRSDFSRAFFGSQTVASTKYSIPWDTVNLTVPRSGTTRGGITFVRSQPA